MIGTILAFDRRSGQGLIRSQGGAGNFSFSAADLPCLPDFVPDGTLVSFAPGRLADGTPIASSIELAPETDAPDRNPRPALSFSS